MNAYVLQVLIGLSQLGNALLGGYADESMSARAWRMSEKGRPFGRFLRRLIDAVFFVITLGRQRHHCQDAYISERSRAQQHPYYRKDRRE